MTKARRKLDQGRTYSNYERRLRAMPHASLFVLHGVWLESFDVYGVFTEALVDCPAIRLMNVAREYGIHVLGVLSACRRWAACPANASASSTSASATTSRGTSPARSR